VPSVAPGSTYVVIVGARLVLWDIDGTLMRAGPIASQVFDRAIELALGRHPGPHGVQMSGKTDPQIAREILTFAEVADEDIDRHLAAILSHLETELAAAADVIRAGGRLLPGIPAVLERLHVHRDVTQSLLTGNIAANAAVKVGAFGLERWLDLDIGAYGSDHADRLQLVSVALGRSRDLRHQELDPRDVWIIGDTPHDLACARAGGARCLLVATGRIPIGELTGIGADAVLEDLSDVDAVVDLLLS
jgi:phosphoglycolate phosphatase